MQTRRSKTRSSGRSRPGSRGIPCYEDSTDNIIGLVYLKDLVQQARAGGGADRCGSRCATRSSCPSRSGWPSCCARCGPRSSTWRSSSTSTAAPRDCHARGPARGDRRRDRRRVRRRGAAGVEQLLGGGLAGPGSHADRRGERGARPRAARHRMGHRGRARLQPARPRAGGGRDGALPGPRVPHRARRRTPDRVGRRSCRSEPVPPEDDDDGGDDDDAVGGVLRAESA